MVLRKIDELVMTRVLDREKVEFEEECSRFANGAQWKGGNDYCVQDVVAYFPRERDDSYEDDWYLDEAALPQPYSSDTRWAETIQDHIRAHWSEEQQGRYLRQRLRVPRKWPNFGAYSAILVCIAALAAVGYVVTPEDLKPWET